MRESVETSSHRPLHRKTATEKASALASMISSFSRPRTSAKSLAAIGLGAAATTFLGPGTADAAAISPTSLNFGAGSNVNWDVDGDGTNDFRFFVFGNASNSTSQMGLYPITAGSPFRVVTQQILIQDAFNNTFSLGFAANYANGAVVPTGAPTATAGNIAFDQNYPTFPAPHTGNIVFKFNASGTPSIAWANISFTPVHNFSAGSYPAVGINSGEFFPVANGPITVGGSSPAVIPEPPHTVAAVFLLAAGALGLREWRRRTRKDGQLTEAAE